MKKQRLNKNVVILTLSQDAKISVKIETLALGAINTAEYKMEFTP